MNFIKTTQLITNYFPNIEAHKYTKNMIILNYSLC